jgi:S1-C subfamily serine protease/thioredoxin-related protein
VPPAPDPAPAPAGAGDPWKDLEPLPVGYATQRKAKAAQRPRALVWGLAGSALVVLLGFGILLATRSSSNSTRSAQPTGKESTAVAQTTVAASQPARKPPQPKDKPAVPAPAGPPAAPQPVSFDEWPQDLEAAKQQAAKEKKDILLFFDASDWCPYSIRLVRAVLRTPAFAQQALEMFVPVHVDFPRDQAAKAKVQDSSRNERLQEEFQVEGYPTVVLADAQGRPYAFMGFEQLEVADYVAHLAKLQLVRVRRDELLSGIATARGADRLRAAGEALDFLERGGLVVYYGALLQDWSKVAGELDPKNEGGFAERFFLAAWYVQLHRGDPNKPEQLAAAVGRLDEWRKNHRVKDADRLAKTYFRAGYVLSLAGKAERAAQCFQAGLACKPSDPRLAQQLTLAAAGKLILGSGTGFAVASGGYLLTNQHVVTGGGRPMVQLRKDLEWLPAQVVAQDEQHDVALLHVKLPASFDLPPLCLTGERPPRRGEKVAASGYPLGQVLGAGIKLTEGSVMALPEPETGNLILLNLPVNPGNSGSPLCDTAGNVIGMVTAKSASSENVVSYGLALPARDLEAFLRKHLKTYKPLPAGTKKMEWDEVDQRVSPSVVMVLKVL